MVLDLSPNKADNLLLLKQRRICTDLYNKSFERIDRLSYQVGFNNLDCVYKTSNHTFKFDDFVRPIN